MPKRTSGAKPKAPGVAGRRDRQPAPDLNQLIGGFKVDPVHNTITATDKLSTAIRDAAPEKRAQVFQQDRETLRRQRILVASGYKLTVDGVYGSRTQAAWNDYMSKQGRSVVVKHDSRDKKGMRADPNGAKTDAQVAAEKRASDIAIDKAVVKRTLEERASLLGQAEVLRQHPERARTLTLQRLALLTSDREAKLTVDTPAGARVVQTWLRAKGENVKVDGVYGEQTYRALDKLAKAEDRKSRNARLYTINRHLYKPNGVRPGDKPSWWMFDGPIPTAEKLSEELAGGGFTAAMKARVLMRRAVTGADAFDLIRHQKLLAIAAKAQPFAAGRFIAGLSLGNLDVQDFNLYTQILGTTDLAPFADLTQLDAKRRPSFKDYAASRAKDKQIQQENEKRRLGLTAQVDALMKSQTADEFVLKLNAYSHLAEKKYTDFQMQLAKGNSSWWGTAVNKIMAPGEFMRTALVYDTMRAAQTYSMWFGWSDPETERAVDWTDAARVMGTPADELIGVDGKAYDGMAGPANGLLRLSFEILADPLNMAHPFRVGSTALRAMTRGQSLGRYAIDGENWYEKALVFEKGTWSKAAVSEGAARLVAGSTYDDFKASTWGLKAQEAANKLLTLKDAAISTARVRVSVRMRHNFGKNRYGTTFDHMAVKDSEVQKLLDTSMVERKEYIRHSPEWQPLLHALLDERGSIWLDTDRSTMSQIGASLFADLTTQARAGAIHQVATESAWDFFEAASHNPKFAGYDEKMLHSLANAEYVRIRTAFGAYTSGGVEKDLAGETRKNLAAAVDARVTQRMDELENSLFPALQEILEDEADALFSGMKEKAKSGFGDRPAGSIAAPVEHPLWDEEGMWRGRKGEAAGSLRKHVRDSFDETESIPNPQFGHRYSWGEASDAIESEIRRRTARLRWWYARNTAAGTLPEGFKIEAAEEKIRSDVTAFWDERSDGWFDMRKELEVSPLYLKHLGDMNSMYDEAWSASNLGPDDFHGKLSALAVNPKIGDLTDVQQGMWAFTWMMGSRYKMRLPGKTFAAGRRFDAVPSGKGIEYGTDDWFAAIEDSIDRSQRLREIITRSQHALARAYDEQLPRELRRNLAYMAAWSKSNSRFGKYSYRAYQAIMNTWVFATLPLRMGWLVRNVADNTLKGFLKVVRNPKYLFLGAERPGAGIRSLLEAQLVPLRGAVQFIDRLMNTNATEHFDNILKTFWTIPSDGMQKIFDAHAVNIPEAALNEARFDPFVKPDGERFSGRPRVYEDEAIALGLRKPPATDRLTSKIRGLGGDTKMAYAPLTDAQKAENRLAYERDDIPPHSPERISGHGLRYLSAKLVANEARSTARKLSHVGDRYASFRENVWELFGNRPENYAKRYIYRAQYDKSYKALEPEYTSHLPGAGHGVAQTDLNFSPEVAADLRRALGVPDDVTFQVEIDRFAHPDYPMNGTYNPNTKVASIELNPWILNRARTRAEIDQLVSELAFIGIHELRHAVQAKSVYRMRLIDKVVGGFYKAAGSSHASKIPMSVWDKAYKLQPHELDANLAAWMQQGRFRDLVKYTGPILPGNVDIQALEKAAHAEAWRAVEETLFDYSKITVLEENFKIFFPFIQFWRKNTTFWAQQFSEKPWLDNALLQIENEREKAHSDLPHWAQRYLQADEIADALAVVPGLDGLFKELVPQDTMYDPLNFASFTPLYRAIKGDNPNLPGEEGGWPIIGAMLDGINEYGLGLNPFFRKSLEHAGVANARAWQYIWPQTGPAVALTREFFGDGAAMKVGGWESVWGLLPLNVPSDQIAANFDYWVQTEVANQVARGEAPDTTAASATIRHWFLVQNLYGYFSGMYLRRATPEDIYITKLTITPSDELTDGDKQLLKLWGMRGMDRLTYQHYIDSLPVIDAYYRASDWDAKAKIKTENPDIIRYVDPVFRGKPFGPTWVQNAQRYQDTAGFFEALKIADGLDLTGPARDAAISAFKTQGLEKFWQRNDTPKAQRDRLIQGEAHGYYKKLNDSYFAIPETDYDARNGFLDAHPELVRNWTRNNDPQDNYEAIYGSANAHLRDMYFHIRDTKGWDGAAAFLKAHPFMFEHTKAEKKVKDGAWVGGGKSGGKHFSPEHLRAFLRAKPHLNWFFDTFMPKVGEKAAWAWLDSSKTGAAQTIKDYFDKWGKHSQKRTDYMKAKPWLQRYFDMPAAERGAWLRGGSEGAKIVLAYFRKYGSGKGMTAHGRDYLKAKSSLSVYFALPKAERNAWLKGSSKDAQVVRDYFKKYSKVHQVERAFLKGHPEFDGGTAEQRKRLKFWQAYFALTPDQRPAYAMAHAEASGIFIYGIFGEQERHDREQEYLRRAVGLGLSKRQSAYLYVKPLLDFYQTLPKDERPLFLRANNELADYFDKYSTGANTGNKKLDGLVEQYFKLPPDSSDRSRFLRQHPQVQDWFDKNASPADRAMHNLLEQYFAIVGSRARQDFSDAHPEIQTYFDRKMAEHQSDKLIYAGFDRSDPRLAPFYDSAADLERSAERMRAKLKQSVLNSLTPDAIESRRERRPTSRP